MYTIPTEISDLLQNLKEGRVRNLFIFGEDPIGCKADEEVSSWIKKAGFKVVQDYFLTPTALEADLILPGSFPAETGGSFTNAQKVIQEFNVELPRKVEKSNIEQLTDLLKKFGFDGPSSRDGIFEEIISLLPHGKSHSKIELKLTGEDDEVNYFDYGCDAVVRMFDEEFENNLKS